MLGPKVTGNAAKIGGTRSLYSQVLGLVNYQASSTVRPAVGYAIAGLRRPPTCGTNLEVERRARPPVRPGDPFASVYSAG